MTMKRILSSLLAAIMVLSIAAFSLAEAVPAETAISLESIAQLNGCAVSDLDTLFDDDGYVTFIGNQISDDVITNIDEAYAYVTEDLASLLVMDGITLVEKDTYSSQLTGMTYYRFDQTLTGNIDIKMPTGETQTLNANVIFMTNTVKLGVDQDGHPAVLVSDLNHEPMDYDTSNMMTAEEAEAVVKAADPDAVIYSDATCITLWEDTSASNSGTTKAGALLVYLVYTDNTNAGDTSCMPYMCYMVDGNRPGKIVANVVADSLTAYSYNQVDNTSLSYFDQMVDKGTYTYTINFSWMSETDQAYAVAYAGADTMEVTVPVMYCETDGLYYLGEKEHYITLSNYVDFAMSMGDQSKLNPYVTDNPEDLSSWHFKTSGSELLQCTYADDPNYVISSFAEYYKVIYAFGDTYHFFESYPTDSYMLQVYYCPSTLLRTGQYPTELSQFEYNAANGGRMYDWGCFYTSPYMGLCLDDVTMCHEFTHGVNMHFASSQYFNEQGAVMESLADMVGWQVAATAVNPSLAESGDWHVGGSCGPVLRDIGNPLSFANPAYKNGIYYVNQVDPVLNSPYYVDCGGVHKNSGIPNYLGYMLVHGTAGDGEETLTVQDGASMWFEVLYLSNYSTDFVDLGADLKFAAKMLGFSAEKQAYLSRVIRDYGFADGVVDQALLDSESSQTFTFHLDFEDPAIAETYYFSDMFVDVASTAIGGGFDNNKDQSFKLPADNNCTDIYMCAQTAEQVAVAAAYIGYLDPAVLQSETTFHVKERSVASGEALTLEAGETVFGNTIQLAAETDEATGTMKITSDPGTRIIMTKADGAADSEYNLYLVCFE